jgi:hypothetical protein
MTGLQPPDTARVYRSKYNIVAAGKLQLNSLLSNILTYGPILSDTLSELPLTIGERYL